MNTCPTCKRPFPPPVVVGGVIRQRMFDLIASRPAGVSMNQIIDAVYADDPNGGPSSPDVVSANIWHINKRLADKGYELRVRCSSRGPGAVYQLQPAIRPNTCPTPAVGLDAKRGGNA